MAKKSDLVDRLPPGTTVELVCLQSGWDKLWARIPPDGPEVIVRQGYSALVPVEGELFTIEIAKSWVFGHTLYVSGAITSATFDLESLALEPLALANYGTAPDEWFGDDLPEEISAEFERLGSVEVYEMEWVVPEGVVELEREADPIVEAVELIREGYVLPARKLLGELLRADLRCLDAHALLGGTEFHSARDRGAENAMRHYGVGVGIGDAALGDGFTGLLPWGLVDNRPYLRCLHGLGLCLWRLGDFDGAVAVFRRLLLFDPPDSRGVRLIWDKVRSGETWAP